MEGLTAVGQDRERLDGRAKVVGAARYTDDLSLPGMLHGKILRGIFPHARLTRVDVSQAEALPGVWAVVTHRDAPARPIESVDEAAEGGPPDAIYVLEPLVRHVGDEIAAVAAVDEATAAAALQAIAVDYEPLPFVLDPEAALRPGAPRVRPSGNLAGGRPVVLARGDIEAGFAAADLVVEDTYRTHFTSALPLEPRACLAHWDGDTLTVWKSGRYVYGDRQMLATVLDLPLERVRVIGPHVGGSFGNKDESRLALITALLSRKTGRPVKISYTLQEELTAGRWRHPSIINLRVGVTRAGEITAIAARCVMNTGPYVPGVSVARRAGHGITYLYRCPNVRYEAFVAYTNTPVAGSYRGLGAPQGHFALESHIDVVARRLDIDPLEFRRRNAVGPEGQPGPAYVPTSELVPPQPIEGGIPFSSHGLQQCLETGAARIGWESPASPANAASTRRRGKGLAMCIYQTGQSPSSALLKINEDGSADLLLGNQDVGQGSSTVLAQIAAEELGIPYERVRGVFADTAVTPYAHGTYGSMTTFSAGSAVRAAAADAKQQLLETAADLLEVPATDLDARDGEIVVKGAPQLRVPIAAVAARRGPNTVVGRASVQPGSRTHIVNSFAAHFAEVEVDQRTGRVRVLRYVAVHDCGRAINPALALGQIEGGVAQSLGYALTEELPLDPESGAPLAVNVNDFKLPTTLDLPRIESAIVDVVDPVGPFGAKAVAEVSIVPGAAAIANAIYDATGVRIRELPFTAERVWNALSAAEASPGHAQPPG